MIIKRIDDEFTEIEGLCNREYLKLLFYKCYPVGCITYSRIPQRSGFFVHEDWEHHIAVNNMLLHWVSQSERFGSIGIRAMDSEDFQWWVDWVFGLEGGR